MWSTLRSSDVVLDTRTPGISKYRLRTETGILFEEFVESVHDPERAELIIFLPCTHKPGATFNQSDLVERNPLLSPPLGIVIELVQRASHIDAHIHIQQVRLTILSHGEITALTRRGDQPAVGRYMRSCQGRRFSPEKNPVERACLSRRSCEKEAHRDQRYANSHF